MDDFATYRDALKEKVFWMHSSLVDPDDDWPAVLLVERPPRAVVLAGLFAVLGLDAVGKDQLATVTIPTRLRDLGALRAALVLPIWHLDSEPPAESLVLLICEPGRCEAVIAEVRRHARAAPSLGPWTDPSMAEGIFVAPILEALTEVRARPACPDCGASVGERHRDGCDVQRCTACSSQWFLCGCDDHDPDRSAWTGEWPGTAECRRRGWFARRVDGQGWAPCDRDSAGARLDLNRLAFFRDQGYDGLYRESLVE